MAFKSYKWEKIDEIIVKVKFLEHSYSTFLEFITYFHLNLNQYDKLETWL